MWQFAGCLDKETVITIIYQLPWKILSCLICDTKPKFTYSLPRQNDQMFPGIIQMQDPDCCYLKQQQEFDRKQKEECLTLLLLASKCGFSELLLALIEKKIDRYLLCLFSPPPTSPEDS